MSCIKNLIKYAYVSLNIDDIGINSGAQVSYFGKTKTIETIFPYGYSSYAPIGSKAVTLNILAEEENMVGFTYNPSSRFMGLKPGEVKIGNQVVQSNIFFEESGGITISPANGTATVVNSALSTTGFVGAGSPAEYPIDASVINGVGGVRIKTSSTPPIPSDGLVLFTDDGINLYTIDSNGTIKGPL